MILIPFAAGMCGVIWFMNYFEDYSANNLLANFDENISNISPANKLRYANSRMGTCILAVSIYLATTIIALNFQSKTDGNDFINDENLEMIEK